MDGYRYHEDGYWSAARGPSTSIVVYNSCYGHGAIGYGPAWYPWHPCAGYAYGPYYGYGGSYALYDPFWPHPYRWPRHYDGGQSAGSSEGARGEARALGAAMDNPGERRFTRYEDLGPLRARDLGLGGGAAGRGYADGYSPARAPSYSPGLSGQERASFGGAARPSGLGSARNPSPSGMSSRSSSNGMSSRSSSNSSSSSSSRSEASSSGRSRDSED